MRYLLSVLLIAAAIVWLAPSSFPLVRQTRSALAAMSASAGLDEQALGDRLATYRSRVREKTMELLRKELHRSVDDLVQ